jgi:hypothetical protein
MGVAIRGRSIRIVILIVDPSRTAHLIMRGTRPSCATWPSRPTFKDACLSDGISHPWLVGNMIPELFCLLLGSLTSMKSESTCFPRSTDRLRGSSSCRAVIRQSLMQVSRTSGFRSALAATSASCSSPRNSSMSSRSNDRSHARSPNSRAVGTSLARRSRQSSLVYASHQLVRVCRRRSVLSGSITRLMPSRSRRRAPPPRAASRNSTRLLPARSDAWKIVSVMCSHLPRIDSKILPKILVDRSRVHHTRRYPVRAAQLQPALRDPVRQGRCPVDHRSRHEAHLCDTPGCARLKRPLPGGEQPLTWSG